MSGMKDLLGDEFYEDRMSLPMHLRGIVPFQAHSTTSREAARSIVPRVPSIKQRVLEFFKSHPNGATDEQLIDAFSMSASTVRPRRIDLVNDGILEDSKRYALTRSGHKATVWQLTQPLDQATWTTLMPPV